jgi:type IV pilus assembly protein PilB
VAQRSSSDKITGHKPVKLTPHEEEEIDEFDLGAEMRAELGEEASERFPAPLDPHDAFELAGVLDEIFADFEDPTPELSASQQVPFLRDKTIEGDSRSEELAAAEAAATQRRDRRIDSVVAGLVRTLLKEKHITERDLEVVFGLTTTKIIAAVNAEAISIYLKEDDGLRFGWIAYARSLKRENPELGDKLPEIKAELMRRRLPHGMGIVGQVIAEGRSHMTLDASLDMKHHPILEDAYGWITKSMLTVPISHEGQVYGAIQVINKHPASGEQFFSKRDLRLVEEVGDYSARVMYMAHNPEAGWAPGDVARYVARLSKCDVIDLDRIDVSKKLADLVGEETIRRYRILPIRKIGTRAITAATDNPLDVHKRDAFMYATDLDIEVMYVTASGELEEAIERLFRKGKADDVRNEFMQELRERKAHQAERVRLDADAGEDSAPVIKLINRIIEDAYTRGASDIHVEPFETELLVRYRIDGVLHEEMKLDPVAARSLTARLKIMAQLDISEHRLPQDGRIRFREFKTDGPDVDLRVATAPMVWGEKTVMRLLDRQSAVLPMNKMGYSKHNLDLYEMCLESPYGMILHCGPTGSGKTTSLYAALNFCNKPDTNIQTAEDPVEYTLKGLNQLHVKPDIGLTFGRALRSFLRQDPDIILVGEIRDLETASIAVEAALTGHQVFSTLHTNDAAGTITRLVEMGIEPFLISGAVLCVCAQRLMRRLCKECRLPHEPTGLERDLLMAEPGEAVTIFTSCEDGCRQCNQTGYKGRVGVHEILVMNEAVRAVAARPHASASQIHQVGVREANLKPMYEDAMEKVKAGTTDIAEALRHVRKA